MKLYSGSLHKKVLNNGPKEVRRALYVYRGQLLRCNNVNAPNYKWYGAKGISVEYTAREFIGWYLVKIKKYKKTTRPSVGRIDHSKNYSLENIELISSAENCKETITRNGPPRGYRPVIMISVKTKGVIAEFNSIKEATDFFKFKNNKIIQQCRRESLRPRAESYYFRFKESVT